MDQAFWIATLGAAVRSGTPLVYAALGGLVGERAGVLNLGLEGVMLVGAVSGFLAVQATQSLGAAVATALLAGAALGVLLATLVVSLRVNQVVAGLALALFGTGLSAHLGKASIGQPAAVEFGVAPVPVLSDIPVLGQTFFAHNLLVYLTYLLIPVAWWVLYKTRLGLHLRATGEAPAAADAMGVNVVGLRFGATVVGSMLAAMGGACLSLALSPTWIENMTAGRGWIALALIVFSSWNPVRVVAGAYLFGGVDALGLRLQASGVTQVPSFFLSMLPYLFTAGVLVVMAPRRWEGAPEALGKPYRREQR